MAVLLRTAEMAQKYREYRKAHPELAGTCPLCAKASLHDFTYWRIVPNSFPYDLVAKKHDMLTPLRHVTDASLTQEELRELVEIKAGLNSAYDFTLEALGSNRSVPDHYHLHLLVIKDLAG